MKKVILLFVFGLLFLSCRNKYVGKYLCEGVIFEITDDLKFKKEGLDSLIQLHKEGDLLFFEKKNHLSNHRTEFIKSSDGNYIVHVSIFRTYDNFLLEETTYELKKIK